MITPAVFLSCHTSPVTNCHENITFLMYQDGKDGFFKHEPSCTRRGASVMISLALYSTSVPDRKQSGKKHRSGSPATTGTPAEDKFDGRVRKTHRDGTLPLAKNASVGHVFRRASSALQSKHHAQMRLHQSASSAWYSPSPKPKLSCTGVRSDMLDDNAWSV